MKYLMLVYHHENSYSPGEFDACVAESIAIKQELLNDGKLCSAAPLHPTTMATSVRIRDGKRLVTDGPFAETTEQLGGFWMIDAANLDDAIAIAVRIPGAKKGTIEVRPVLELPGLTMAG